MSETVLQPSGLTAEKRAIVDAVLARPDAAVLVDAIAGSGKTTLLAHLALALVQSGIAPERIGVVTVSNTAAGHLNDLLSALGRAHGTALPQARTIHAVCLSRLQDCIRGGFSATERLRLVTDRDGELQDVLRESIELARQQLGDEIDLPHPSPANLQSLHLAIGRIKGERRVDLAGLLESDEQPDLEWLAERLQQPVAVVACLIAFERCRERLGFHTFHDVPNELIRIRSLEPDSRRALVRFDALLVDEANDLNPALLEAVLLTRRSSGRTVLVADRHQCVLSHTGASSTVLSDDLPALLAGVTAMPLSASHRFGEALARRLRPLAFEGDAATFFRSEAAHRTRFSVRPSGGPADLCTLLANARKSEPGWTVAVLWRSRAEALASEFALVERGQPYTMVGHRSVAHEPLIMGLMGLLFMPAGLLDGCTPKLRAELICAAAALLFPLWPQEAQQASRDELVRQQPCAGLGLEFGRLTLRSAARLSPVSEEVDRRLERVLAWLDEQATAAGGRKPAEAGAVQLEALLQRLELRKLLVADNLDPSQQHELLSVLEALEAFVAGRADSLQALAALYVAAHATVSSSEQAARRSGSLTLSTFLRIKGMERDLVIVGDASADVVPVGPDLANPFEDSRELAITERNLWYVAVTRARQALIVLHARDKAPCGFVEQMRGKAKAAALPAAQPAAPVEPAVVARAPDDGRGRAAFSALVARLNREDGEAA
ncbi:UvrD-helicase domain-containing protein [Chitinimonas koreensis]|uniref:UvrD-helicase domain-containing protein n=1 Tax=Chitinimonas koreensis TaxID=356302 RepID=UPI000412FE77|nr:UvrD-helicase domain-containing protein [Chitinimonas koreensis]QNM96017.1 ATP-dependent helicase [Chitinimonas koreensis]